MIAFYFLLMASGYQAERWGDESSREMKLKSRIAQH